MNTIKIAWFGVLLLLLTACANYKEFNLTTPIEGSNWKSDKAIRFEYHSTDTVLQYDVSVNIRHTGLYKYNNIYLFITTIAPNGKSVCDTSEFTLADARGKWAGSGIGDLYDVNLAYKYLIRFSQSGKYIFTIQHGMRDLKLAEITDVGLTVKPSEKE